jgi:hypothetical protein
MVGARRYGVTIGTLLLSSALGSCAWGKPGHLYSSGGEASGEIRLKGAARYEHLARTEGVAELSSCTRFVQGVQ